MTIAPFIDSALKFVSSYHNKDWEGQIQKKVDSILAQNATWKCITFFNNGDAELWGTEAFNDSVKEVIDEHNHEGIWRINIDKPIRSCHEALKLYYGHGHKNVNYALRFNFRNFWDDESDIIIEYLDSRLGKSNTPKSIIVARWVEEASFVQAFPNLRISQKIMDKGFLSTSLNIRYAKGHDEEPKRKFDQELLLLIRVPKGSSCLYVSTISNRKHEQEVLLPRNTTLLVEGIHKVFFKNKIIVCSVC